MSNKKIRIAFAGPIAELNKPAKGGYQAANRRTITLLKEHGVDVLEMPYPYVESASWRKTLSYLIGFTGIAFKMVLNKNKWDIFHLTPLRRQFIRPEILLCRLAKSLGKKVFLDLRAGNLIVHQNSLGENYAALVDKMISLGDIVGVEGQEYVEFVEQRTDREVLYFPNYVSWAKAYEDLHKPLLDQSNAIKFVCLGRVVPAKGVDISIETIGILKEQGVQAHLTVIGSGDQSYMDKLKEQADDLPVEFTGPLSPDQITKRLEDIHFFMFPTTHSGEGHSNALTEAMAMGCVPICSDNGFNRSVVKDTGLVLSMNATAQDYAEKILPLINNPEDWRKLSESTTKRVKDNYSDKAVINKLLEKYNDLLK